MDRQAPDGLLGSLLNLLVTTLGRAMPPSGTDEPAFRSLRRPA
jgi:hypothetical protein